MSFSTNPRQALLLWSLLITGDQPAKSKLNGPIREKPKERDALVKEGLIEYEKRGRSEHVVLTDKAWDWAAENLGIELSKSTYAANVLQALLSSLGMYIASHRAALADIIRSSDASSTANIDSHEKINPLINEGKQSMESLIIEAYEKITQGRYSVRVKLSTLRAQLPQLSRDQIDSTLCNMELSEKVVLMHLDDPQQRTSVEDQAAIDIQGSKRHIVYMRP